MTLHQPDPCGAGESAYLPSRPPSTFRLDAEAIDPTRPIGMALVVADEPGLGTLATIGSARWLIDLLAEQDMPVREQRLVLARALAEVEAGDCQVRQASPDTATVSLTRLLCAAAMLAGDLVRERGAAEASL